MVSKLLKVLLFLLFCFGAIDGLMFKQWDAAIWTLLVCWATYDYYRDEWGNR